jgi:uncharacterized membrane protein YphA (DoxX/SURF4 family)
MKRSLLIDVACCLLALLFTYAAVSKLTDFSEFKLQLSKSPFITIYSNLVASLLPVVELIVALLLAFPFVRLIGLYASLFLLTLFTAYLVAMLNFSYYIPCSCGGVLSSLSWSQHVILNIVFLILSLIGIWLHTTHKKCVRV